MRVQQSSKRICNICGLSEGDCLEHIGVHPALWSLYPEKDANGNARVSYKMYQKLHAVQMARAVNLPPRSSRKS